MHGKPGTLLVVRKKNRKPKRRGGYGFNEPDGINQLFYVDNPDGPTGRPPPWIAEYVALPYGAAVMLLSLEPAPTSYKKQRMRMRILWGEKKLVGYLSKGQIDRWFTFPYTWKNRNKAEDPPKNAENTDS